MTLPFDICRCLGERCDRMWSWQLHLELDHLGPMTAGVEHLRSADQDEIILREER